jgi:hypothetical protein
MCVGRRSYIGPSRLQITHPYSLNTSTITIVWASYLRRLRKPSEPLGYINVGKLGVTIPSWGTIGQAKLAAFTDRRRDIGRFTRQSKACVAFWQ